MSGTRLHVLHVVNGLGTGGAERSLAEVIPALRGHGVDVTIAVFFRRAEGVQRSVVDGGTAVRFLDATTLVRRVRLLRRLLSEIEPDVVHTTIFEADIAGRLAAARAGIPVVSSVVNVSYGPARRRDPRVAEWRLELARMVDGVTARRLCAQIHAVTADVGRRATLDLRVPREMVTVIERGRDTGRLGTRSASRTAHVRDRLGLPLDAEVVIAAGRHEYQKGYDVLLDAATRLQHRRPALHLLVAGRQGAATPELEALRQSAPDPHRIHLLGHRDDLPDLVAAADVLASASRYEGAAGALIEALALGTPVAAAKAEGLPDCFRDPAVVVPVPVEDPGALAAGIETILTDTVGAAARAKRGRDLVRERFTIEACADSTAALYRRLTAEG